MRLPLAAFLVLTSTTLAPGATPVSAWRLFALPDGRVGISAPEGARAVFAPNFTVLHSVRDPNLELRWGKFPEPAMALSDTGSIYNVLTWGPKSAKGATAAAHIEDGFDPTVDRGYGAGRTANLFAAGRPHLVRGTTALLSADGRQLTWTLPASPVADLSATLDLPADGTAPRLTLTATARVAGWFSFGYTGAPEVDPAAATELWQPLIYNERRFPHESFLEAGFRCPLPTTLVSHGGTTVGVVADAAEYPFQPLPNFANSRFGVALRNAAGRAQPMLFAPLPGGAGSALRPGEQRTFAMRLFVAPGTLSAAYERIARTLFGFADLRHNALGSLNATFERMLDFGLSEYAKFNADLRGFAYDTDVPGAVKNVSALHPLGLALVTDRRDIFERLARPQIEYFLSRERFLFTTDPKTKGQSASSRLGGLGAPLTEYANLHAIARGRTPAFRAAAETLFGRDRVLNLEGRIRGDNWSHALALYRATGERRWLDHAIRDADAYLRRRVAVRPADYADPDSRGLFFWTAFTPQWIELLELYEETREPRYLAAAHQGARDYAQFVWLSPAIPSGDIRVHEDGRAPAYRSGPRFPRIAAAPETVPAWRTSEIGLTSESAPTSKGARGIFLACYAPWMLRLSALTGDRFLHDLARSAVIGRYTSFPGYHLNTARNTAYEKPDFARRGKDELNSATSIHYNHIWPHLALVLDYLVTDAFARSRGAVDFPGRYAEGYGYLQQKIYGDRPGRIHDTPDLWLWMPRGVVAVGHPELNYITARGAGTFALVLTNQSRSPVTASVALNRELLAWSAASRVVRWEENRRGPEVALPADGRLEVAVAAEGITTLIGTGVTARPGFQADFLATAPALPAAAGTTPAFRAAKTHVLRLGGGPGLTTVYTYLPDFDREIARCTLRWRQEGSEQAIEDRAFPFDFTIVPPSTAPLEYWYEVQLADGRTEQSPVGTVRFQ